ncbi:TPA: 30S ribosomal protein S20 [Candidatus Acetothermia bacterium]|nr:30S ribosomal protein S20 [Candidatus Bipolaricaulota bacterium]HAF70047.1 30S ribosomal protein S20 [Candidatus Acetothermia bacterium]
MPNTQSAKRQLRKSLRRRRRNELRKSAIRYWRHQLERLVEAGRLDEAREAFSQFQKAVDKAAQRRAIHPNRAARLKARMARRLNPA